MPTIVSTARRVALTPFETKEVEVKNVKGFSTIGQKTTLTALKVVYDYVDEKGDVKLKTGSTVWLHGDIAKDERFSRVLEVEQGKKFILLPLESILLVSDDWQ